MNSTDRGNAQIDREQAQASEKVATMNAKAAVNTAEQTRDELTNRIVRLEAMTNSLTQKLANLDRKYNLLLTKRFNTGPTDGNNG